ncbi:MAG: MBL fold metallo-hydrolase [Oligoflexia bacterium]|nr:MBL fold metallo-hydrolase [Oligoflexia bacterium]
MKIYLIQHIRSPWPSRFLFEDAKLASMTEISIGGILIEHPEGFVLVDNGMGLMGTEYSDQVMTAADGYKIVVSSLIQSLGEKIPLVKTLMRDEIIEFVDRIKIPFRIRPSVAAQLKSQGISLDDIKHVVFTHLHYDHVGDVSKYQRARIWVSQREMRAAQSPLAFLNGYNPLIAQWDYRTERILDPLVIRPEISPFSIVKDLFGDERILILSTPGHTPGSLSVLVKGDEHQYFLCGDSCYCRESYRDDRSPGRLGFYGFDHNPRLAQSTRQKILKWEQSQPDLQVLPMHDINVWTDDQIFPRPWSGKR